MRVCVRAGMGVCAQVLSWFLDHEEENGLSICRLKNKFAFKSNELVGGSRRTIACRLKHVQCCIDQTGVAIAEMRL